MVSIGYGAIAKELELRAKLYSAELDMLKAGQSRRGDGVVKREALSNIGGFEVKLRIEIS